MSFVLLQKEIHDWILPGYDEDPIQSEANHLMKLGDDDKVIIRLIVTCQFQATG